MEHEPRYSIFLMPNTIEERIAEALETGETGDKEVVAELARRCLVQVFVRKDEKGVTQFSLNDARVAVKHDLDILPKPSPLVNDAPSSVIAERNEGAREVKNES